MSDELRYGLRILVIHPSLTPDEISDQLKLNPDMSACVGMPRQAPNGHPLPGIYKDTRWSVSEWRIGDRYFLKRMGRMLARLEPHKAFLRSLSETGGEVNLIVELPGDVNIGDSLPIQDVARLADLGIELGIEVFPQINPRPEETIWREDP